MDNEEFAKHLLSIRDRFIKGEFEFSPVIKGSKAIPGNFYAYGYRTDRNTNVFFYSIDEYFYWLNDGNNAAIYKKPNMPVPSSNLLLPNKIYYGGDWVSWNVCECREIKVD